LAFFDGDEVTFAGIFSNPFFAERMLVLSDILFLLSSPLGLRCGHRKQHPWSAMEINRAVAAISTKFAGEKVRSCRLKLAPGKEFPPKVSSHQHCFAWSATSTSRRHH
jgi:hypothetical protein